MSISKIVHFIRHSFRRLGPGFITGAADDDPSGIATYSIAAAQFGYKLGWLSLFLFPLMTSVQEMCGRIGMISGTGIAGCIRKYHSKRLLYFTVFILFIANTVNIGADLGAMAASVQMIVGLPFLFWLFVITIITIAMEIFIPYSKYVEYLKWLAFSLFAYGITALITKQDWGQVLRYTLIPHIEFTGPFLMTLVGFLGTTISPYLFFWQSGEMVEEAIRIGKIKDFEEKPNILLHEIRHMRFDTRVGMLFSNLITFFIILTATATLHKNGITDIETPQQAALALKPLAGDLAYLLFAVGIIGIGLQSVPILAGSIAYAFSEAFGFKEGLAKKLTEAKAFYATIAIATVVGALINLLGINPIKALYYTAILNAIIAIPLIAIIIRLADDKRIIGKHKSTPLSRILAWITFAFMLLAALLLLVQFVFPNLFSR